MYHSSEIKNICQISGQFFSLKVKYYSVVIIGNVCRDNLFLSDKFIKTRGNFK